ncbi:MAG: TonB family protein [Candidatus Synoicihabitans palmerolidicus]|nr:TonB family protein [Candidatus Synoicihabitans palmerolidicus]
MGLKLLSSSLLLVAVSSLRTELEDTPRLPTLAPQIEGISELQPGWAHYLAPEFPLSLQNTTLQGGFATLAYTLTDDGLIDDCIVLAASHPDFGDAILAVMPEGRIDPRAYAARTRRDTRMFEFERHGIIMSGTQRDASRSAVNPAGDQVEAPLSTVPEQDLGQHLELIGGQFPPYPSELKGYVNEGEAILEFVVDASGRARMPAVVYATNPTFGRAVLTQIGEWRFTPPTKAGKPIQAFVTRSVQFALRRK